MRWSVERLGIYFVAACGLGLIVGFILRPLLPFVLGGILIGVVSAFLGPALKSVPRHRLNSVVKWSAILAVVSLSAAGVVFGLSSISKVRGPGSPGALERTQPRPTKIVLPVEYAGRAVFKDSSSVLTVRERIFLSYAAIERTAAEVVAMPVAIAPSVGLRGSVSSLTQELAEGVHRDLIRHLWRAGVKSQTGEIFVAPVRHLAFGARPIPMDTGHTVHLRSLPAAVAMNALVRLKRNRGSQFVILAPSKTIDATYPSANRQKHLISGQEELSIDLAGVSAVEANVRSPWFRGGLGGTIASFVLSGAVWLAGVLLLLFIAVLSEPVKRRIRRLFKIPEQT